MTDHNIARGCKSPWTSPLILVPKPREKRRIWTDFRKINAITDRDSYPLPNIVDILNCLWTSKYF